MGRSRAGRAGGAPETGAVRGRSWSGAHDAWPAEAACAARAVGVVGAVSRQLQIEDGVALGHIQPSSGQVGDEQGAELPLTECGEDRVALPLG